MAAIGTIITDPIPGLNTAWGTNVDHAPASGIFASDEVKIDAVNRTIQLRNAGNLTTLGSGATGQALYSFLKYHWKDTADLTQYPFPMLSITNEQFEFIDGWTPADDTTRKMIRSAGWAETNGSTVNRRYAGIVTLGTMVDDTDQAYYVQNSSFTAVTETTDFTGPVNEAVAIYMTATGLNDINFASTSSVTSTTTDFSVFKVGDSITFSGTTGGTNNVTVTVATVAANALTFTQTTLTASGVDAGTVTLTANRNSFFKIFVRERGKTYDDSALGDIGVDLMNYIVYRFPLTNTTDIKILTTADTDIDSNGVVPADVSPYDLINVTYLNANIIGAAQAGNINVNDVVSDANSRWFRCTATGTIDATDIDDLSAMAGAGTATFEPFAGEREVEDGTFSAYNIIIDANDTGTVPGATKEAVYEWAQWALRRTGTIDEVAQTRKGEIADTLVYFVGDTLHTNQSVFVDDIAAADYNNIVFHDYEDATHVYPSVVTVTINFNGNLAADPAAVFRVYYTSVSGGAYGTVNALEVVTNDLSTVGSNVSNLVPDGTVEAGSSYSFSYAYDGDTTGGRIVSTPVNITVVAIGLETGQYVKTSGNITDQGGTFSLVAPFERNYSNP